MRGKEIGENPLLHRVFVSMIGGGMMMKNHQRHKTCVVIHFVVQRLRQSYVVIMELRSAVHLVISVIMRLVNMSESLLS